MSSEKISNQNLFETMIKGNEMNDPGIYLGDKDKHC